MADKKLKGVRRERRRDVAGGAAAVVGWVVAFNPLGPMGWNVLIALPSAAAVGVLLWRFGNKPVLYVGCTAVLLLAVAFTVGVAASPSQTVSSVVVAKRQETEGGFPGGVSTDYVVVVTCQDSKTGHLSANLRKSDWDELHVGDRVELRYHEESILGVWDCGLAVNSINSQAVWSGGGSGFHGSGYEKFVSSVSLAGGVVLLSSLIYWHSKGKL